LAPGAFVVAARVVARTLLEPPRLETSLSWFLPLFFAFFSVLDDEKNEKNGEKIELVPDRFVLDPPFFTLPLRLPPSSSSPSNARLRATWSPVAVGAFEPPV
jgi:hypothetical protein